MSNKRGSSHEKDTPEENNNDHLEQHDDEHQQEIESPSRQPRLVLSSEPITRDQCGSSELGSSSDQTALHMNSLSTNDGGSPARRAKRKRDDEASEEDSRIAIQNIQERETDGFERFESAPDGTTQTSANASNLSPARHNHRIIPNHNQNAGQNQMMLLPSPALLIGYDGAGNPIHVPTSPMLFLMHFFASLMGAAAEHLNQNPAPMPTPAEHPSLVPSFSPAPSDVALMPPPPRRPRRSFSIENQNQISEQQDVHSSPHHQHESSNETNNQALPAQEQSAQPQVPPFPLGDWNVLQSQLLQQVDSARAMAATMNGLPPFPPPGFPGGIGFHSSVLPSATTADQALRASLNGLAHTLPQVVGAAQGLSFPPWLSGLSGLGTQTSSGVPNDAGTFRMPNGTNTPVRSAAPKLLRPPVSLYMVCDDDHLSDYQILIRKQLEIFEAQPEYAQSSTRGRKKQLVLGQIGIRCKHCALLPYHQRGKGAVYYPAKLDGLYQAAQNMAKSHLCESCNCIDESSKQELVGLRESKTVGATRSGGKQYWADGAKSLGIYETGDGLRFSSD